MHGTRIRDRGSRGWLRLALSKVRVYALVAVLPFFQIPCDAHMSSVHVDGMRKEKLFHLEEE